METKKVIAIAEKVGLLYADERFPYNKGAHQRLIARLQNFAKLILIESQNEQKKGSLHNHGF